MSKQSQGDNAFRRAARGAFWGGFAAISCVIAYQAAMSEKGVQRLADARAEAVQLAGLYHDLRNGPGAVQLASARDGRLDLAAEVETVRERVARLEDQFGAVTGSLQARGDAPGYSMLSPVREEARPGLFAPKTGEDDVSQIMRTSFAVALASAAEVAPLERTWDEIKKSFSSEISGLQPHIKLDRGAGRTTLVLLAGPLANAKDAAALCARLTAVGRTCRTVPLTGPTIALKSGGQG